MFFDACWKLENYREACVLLKTVLPKKTMDCQNAHVDLKHVLLDSIKQ